MSYVCGERDHDVHVPSATTKQPSLLVLRVVRPRPNPNYVLHNDNEEIKARRYGQPQQALNKVPRILSLTLSLYPPPLFILFMYFSICLFISHPIITKFCICNLVVSINIFRTFFE